MSKVELEITRKDIQTAMLNYLSEKYPNLKVESMFIEYNKARQSGTVDGYLK